MADCKVVRVLLRHYWKNWLNVSAAVREVCSVQGEERVDDSITRKWFQRFWSWDTKIENKFRSGRPEALHWRHSQYQYSGVIKAPEFGIYTSSASASGSLGGYLTPQQALLRVDICRQLLANSHDKRFLRSIVTRDVKADYPAVPQHRYPVVPARLGGRGGCPTRAVRVEACALHLAELRGPHAPEISSIWSLCGL